nr:pyridoxal-dependent decarboxylase [Cryobacterium algoricola]
MSSAVQVCWEKFCNYLDVEPRFVPISEQHPSLDGHDLASYVDENTICVVAIIGVTYTGSTSRSRGSAPPSTSSRSAPECPYPSTWTRPPGA